MVITVFCQTHELAKEKKTKKVKKKRYLFTFFKALFLRPFPVFEYYTSTKKRGKNTGCKIRRVDEKMKCSKTCQNELKTCQNGSEYYSECEFASEMPWKPCFIRVLVILGLIFSTSTPLILLPVFKSFGPNKGPLRGGPVRSLFGSLLDTVMQPTPRLNFRTCRSGRQGT